ncbi:MAG TPA: FG-GAP-like repeat-containing protein [Candidatus Acidoferrum sp.]|nr:FG-GAP-like repeat-containing protein [Candidatus Acidoferrum sp.]
MRIQKGILSGNTNQSLSHRRTCNAFQDQLRHLRLLLCLAGLILVICVPHCVGSTVTSSGQFATEIPIIVPPFHGLEPKLSLVYGSSPANGWIGAGWELAGGPSYIVRASKGRGAPRFDGSDIFLLDGMELVPCSPTSVSPSCTSAVAAFGSSNGFYSTKIENFQRIQYVSASNSWTIWAKSGTQRVFQADPVPNPPGTQRWGLTSETDTHGNQVVYGYGVDVSDQPPTASYLSSIAYNSSANAGITFYGASRPDAVTYGNGQAVARMKQRLQSIDVSYSLNRIRVYALNYHTSSSTSGSLLDSVQMFGSDAKVNCGTLPVDTCDTSKPFGLVVSGTSLPPTSFQYDETATGQLNAVQPKLAASWGYPLIAGDFNGDGKTDYLAVTQFFATYLSNGDGTFTQNNGTSIPDWCQINGSPSHLAWTCFPNGSSVVVGDFNGDGKTDFIVFSDNMYVFLSNGDGTFRVVPSKPPAYCGGLAMYQCVVPPVPGATDQPNFPFPDGRRRPRVISAGEIITGDFNGDGKTDFLVASDNFYTYLSSGDGTFRVVTMSPPPWCRGQASGCLNSQPNHIVVGDFDGDGRTDFLSANGNFDVFRSKGDGTFTWKATPPPAECQVGTTLTAASCLSTARNAVVVGDFNGDGKTEFASAVTNHVFLSNGDGSFTLVTGAGVPQGLLIAGDFNGDGKTDIMSVSQNFDLWISLGDGRFEFQRSTPPPTDCATATKCIIQNDAGVFVTGDFNGDGKADFFSKYTWLAVGGPADHLINISSGLGASTVISYTPSSNYINTYVPVGAVFQTVASTTISDTATGVSDTYAYKYSGGLWLDVDRRFLGFGTVTETVDAVGDYRQTLYNQTPACYSQPLQTYLKDSSGLIYNFSVFSYVAWTGPAPYQCLHGSRTDYQAERTCKDWASCAQSGAARAISTDFHYDSYGNLYTKIEHGDLSVKGDERTTQSKFINPNVSAYIVALPCQIQIFPGEDTSAQPLRKTLFDYDKQATPCQATIGDLTDRQDYVSNATKPAITQFDYDSYGNQKSITDANNHKSTKEFDQAYNLYPIKNCNPLVQCSTLSWDTGLGKITLTTDPNGAMTKYSYDVVGRLTQVANPDGGIVQYAYELTANPSGQPTGQKTHETVFDGSSDGLWTDTFSDGLGRTYRIVGKAGYEKDIQYSDSTGNPSTESHWYISPNAPQWTRYSYDAARRLVETILPDSSCRTSLYSIAKVTKLDELGQDTTFYTDAYGRIVKVQEHNGGNSYPTTTYTYDALGELTKTQDAAGNFSLMASDMLGRKLTEADPDMGAWSYAYDLVGNVLTQTDGKGQIIAFSYDALNRLLTKTYPDGSSVTRNYDEASHGSGIGRLTSITETAADGTQKSSDSFSYDSLGRATSATKCRAGLCFTINSTYDKAGRVSQFTYPDSSGKISAGSETVTYRYDPSGRLSSIAGLVPYVSKISYDPDGKVSSITYGNGVSGQFSYDPARRWLNSAGVLGPESPPPSLYAATYVHDSGGHIKEISSSTDQLLNLNFTYDSLGRLTQVSGAQTQQFAYNDIGNVMSNSAVGVYSYPVPQNCSPATPCFTHPHQVIAAGGNAYTYDANGNMISGAGRMITWNFDNLPLSVTTSAGRTTFDYDTSNRRVSKSEPGASSPTYYFSPLVERTPSGDLVYSYYAGQTLVARRMASSSTVVWYHQDQLASVRLITDGKGNVTHNYDYAAFGTTLMPAGDPPDPYGFTGQLRNPSTSASGGDAAGLIYMNARYYDATLGRFISADSIVPDPMNPQSLNRYSYVLNNPVSFNDPTGHHVYGNKDCNETQSCRDPDTRPLSRPRYDLPLQGDPGLALWLFQGEMSGGISFTDTNTAVYQRIAVQEILRWGANGAKVEEFPVAAAEYLRDTMSPEQLGQVMEGAMSASAAPSKLNTDIGMIAEGFGGASWPEPQNLSVEFNPSEFSPPPGTAVPFVNYSPGPEAAPVVEQIDYSAAQTDWSCVGKCGFVTVLFRTALGMVVPIGGEVNAALTFGPALGCFSGCTPTPASQPPYMNPMQDWF